MSDAVEYSVENATRFGWSSISDDLNPGRTALLDQQLVGKRVLDAGCGGGGYCAYLASKGLSVVGVDLHDKFLDLARQRYPEIKFCTADLTRLPFADNEFETVFCFDVLEHIDDTAALQELVRIASRRVILAVPREADEMLPFNLVFSTYQDTTHKRYYSEKSLKELIERSSPSAKYQIAPELMLPVNLILPYVCDATACGYLGWGGFLLRLMKMLGLDCDVMATRRGGRLLNRIASQAANRIPTGLTATIELT